MSAALLHTSQELEQALDREEQLANTVVALEAQCTHLAEERMELLETIEELTQNQVQRLPVPAAPNPLASVGRRPTTRPKAAPAAIRRSRGFSIHVEWDELPDEDEVAEVERMRGPWYLRPAAIGALLALVFCGALIAASSRVNTDPGKLPTIQTETLKSFAAGHGADLPAGR